MSQNEDFHLKIQFWTSLEEQIKSCFTYKRHCKLLTQKNVQKSLKNRLFWSSVSYLGVVHSIKLLKTTTNKRKKVWTGSKQQEISKKFGADSKNPWKQAVFVVLVLISDSYPSFYFLVVAQSKKTLKTARNQWKKFGPY